MSDHPKPRMKRSRSLTLTTLMAGAAVSVSACDNSPAVTQWGDPPTAESGRTVEARTFASLDDCKASGDFTAQQCEATLAEAQKDSEANAPRFANQQSCEERYGVDQCVPRSSQGGGSFFTPLLTGFIIGQALNNMGGYRGAPMYRDRDGTYYGGGGYSLSRDYVTGRPRVRAESFDAPSRMQAPSRVQSRSFVISRGGFGGGHSFGG